MNVIVLLILFQLANPTPAPTLSPTPAPSLSPTPAPSDGRWSNWYGSSDSIVNGSVLAYHMIEGSSDTDSMREICVDIADNVFIGDIKATFDSGYTSGSSSTSGDTVTCFELSTGEYITSVSFNFGNSNFRMLQFTSSLGTVYGPYGDTTAAATDTVSGGTDEELFKMEVKVLWVRYSTISTINGIIGLRFFFDDESESTCDSHEHCPDDDTFCNNGQHCDYCSECQYCHDGIDGTCGSCGDGYPTQESDRNCTEPVWYVFPTDIGDGANAVNGGVVAMVFGFAVLIMG